MSRRVAISIFKNNFPIIERDLNEYGDDMCFGDILIELYTDYKEEAQIKVAVNNITQNSKFSANMILLLYYSTCNSFSTQT